MYDLATYTYIVFKMPKQKKEKRIRKQEGNFMKGFKRRIEDRNLTSFSHISDVEHYPKYENFCSEAIRPSTSDLNKSGTFVFNIKTGKDEIILIPSLNQLTVEGRTYVSLQKSKIDTVSHAKIRDDTKVDEEPDIFLHAQTPYLNADTQVSTGGSNHCEGWSSWRYGIGTGAGILFDRIECSYNGMINDESSNGLGHGQFFNQEAAIAFYTCGDNDQIEYEKTFGHFIPWNDLTSAQGSPYEIATRKMFHVNQEDYKAPGKKDFSRRFYVTLPGYPFRSLTRWFAKDGNFTDKMTIIPPSTHIKVCLRRNFDFRLLDLGDNMTEISTYANRLCATRQKGASDLTTEVKFEYDDAYITVYRAIPEQKFTLYKNGQFSTPFTYSRCNQYDLPTGAKLYSPEISWDTRHIPDVVFLYFVREFDLINETPGKNLTLSSNRFFRPLHMKSIKIQQRSQNGIEPLNCLYITNLDKNDYHDSKERYFHYLQRNGFLSSSVKFEQLFEVQQTSMGVAGSLNIFPINFRQLTGIENSLYMRGLKVTLEFSQVLQQNWRLVALFQYQGVVRYHTRRDNEPPTIAFETDADS